MVFVFMLDSPLSRYGLAATNHVNPETAWTLVFVFMLSPFFRSSDCLNDANVASYRPRFAGAVLRSSTGVECYPAIRAPVNP